jgi:hypothetical protein
MTTRWLMFLCAVSFWGLACEGAIGGGDPDAAILDGTDGDSDARDAGDASDAADDGDAGGDADAGDADAGDDGDAADAGDDSTPVERCPPLSGAPPARACLAAGWTDFALGDLLLLDAPSIASEGADFILQLSPAGAVVRTVVSQGEGITGMSDLVLDPLTGDLLYSVSDWWVPVFEIREIDASGTLVHTYPMPEGKNGGNIALAFDHLGTLYVAYDDAIYTRPAGESSLTSWWTIPAGHGLGEIDLDRRGNVYLTDPFVTESVIRIAADGTSCTLAGPEEGLNSPYGLTVLASDEVFVGGIDPETYTGRIHRIDAAGTVTLAAEGISSPGAVLRGLDADAAGLLYATVEGPAPALYAIHPDGSAEPLAGAEQGLGRPARVATVSTPYPCE